MILYFMICLEAINKLKKILGNDKIEGRKIKWIVRKVFNKLEIGKILN